MHSSTMFWRFPRRRVDGDAQETGCSSAKRIYVRVARHLSELDSSLSTQLHDHAFSSSASFSFFFMFFISFLLQILAGIFCFSPACSLRLALRGRIALLC